MYNFSKSLWITIILAYSYCIVPQAQASTPATSMTQPLAYYINANEVEGDNLRLANGTDQITAIIPISSRSDVTGINIHIKFINSISLSKDRSQIRFRFNGQVVGQVPLDPLYPEGSINLSIPKSMVRAGNNQLIFESS
ncbi:MAG: cellulose biosynthesis cyclic di-GMP-binding regulatory protein BcsB, partial [Ghiorsea sp.]|nr:cellulose biosynthesis cyclic di-GMP-binding regulatory protein BcsB [Ghiorsea sp.]